MKPARRRTGLVYALLALAGSALARGAVDTDEVAVAGSSRLGPPASRNGTAALALYGERQHIPRRLLPALHLLMPAVCLYC